jgi:hypothetical protein
MSMSDVSDRERFDFEREKWRADVALRERDTALKERDNAAARWRSPLVVAIFAAAVAAIGNAGVAYLNGSQQLAVESGKAESARILEMIKTGDSDAAAHNLDFLLKAGLITDPDRVGKVAAFLKTRPAGTGPALPSPSGRVAFEPSDALNDGMRQSLDNLLQGYIARLDSLGFPAGERVSIKVQSTGSNPNAYYMKNAIVIDPKLAVDRSVPLREYGHHVLTAGRDIEWRGFYAAVESGLADYLACSYLDNPRLGEAIAKLLSDKPFIRNLDNDQSFADFAKGVSRDDLDAPYKGAEVWGGLFWNLRTELGRDSADALVASAWLATKWPEAEDQKSSAFAAALLAAAAQKTPASAASVRKIMTVRRFPVPN